MVQVEAVDTEDAQQTVPPVHELDVSVFAGLHEDGSVHVPERPRLSPTHAAPTLADGLHELVIIVHIPALQEYVQEPRYPVAQPPSVPPDGVGPRSQFAIVVAGHDTVVAD